MKRKKKVLFAACLLGALVASGGALALVDGGQVTAAEPALTETVTLEDVYALGTEFSVPKTNITVDGKEYSAVCVVRYPDGSVYSGEKVTLDVEGKYVLEYRASTENGIAAVEKEFYVSNYLFAVSGKQSSAAYGVVENAPERPGIVTSLAYGDRLLYNQTINLSENTKNDTIAQLFVNPIQQGLSDAINVSFVLTDLYDSENYVTVTCKRLDREPLQAAWQELSCYITANAVNQAPSGLEFSNNNYNITWEGNNYLLHSNNLYGTSVRFAMAGVPNLSSDCSNIGKPTDIASQSLTFSMDYETRRVYMNGSLVIDLDDTSLFKSVQWGGFTTGECKLSIYASGYNQESFNFVLTEAGGLKGEALASGLMFDDKGPEISLAYGDYAESGFPTAIVGRTYPVPTAIGYDEWDKEVSVKARVYKDYGTNGQINIPTVDGAFIPERAGNYTVIYTAADKYGNASSFRYDLEAVVCEDPLSIVLTDKVDTGSAGLLVSVATAEVVNPQGLADVKVYARLQNKGVEVEIPTEGADAYTFRPLYAGNWEIVYEYSDYMENKTESYFVDISVSQLPYIEKDVALPRYVIRGATYALPTLEGLVFETGDPVTEKAKVYIRDDDGAERELSSTRFTSYADAQTTISYRLGEGDNLVEKSYVIPVVDVGYDKMNLSIKDYFVGEGFDVEASNSNIVLTAKESSGTQSFEFINAVQAFDFKVLFHVSTSINKYNAINIYLTDSEDSSVTVKVTYTKNRPSNTLFTVNDGAISYVSTGDFVESSADNFRLLYNNVDKTISPSSDYDIKVTHDLSGRPFEGFASSKVYMRVELVDITGKAGIEMISLNNQPLSKVSYDLLRPEISTNPIRGEKHLGDEITLAPTFAGDVLDPGVVLKMTVKGPDGNIVVSKEGVSLDSSADPGAIHTIVANQYGKYSVEYTCQDANENKTVYSYVFTVIDITPPTVTLGAHATTAKVGSTVVIANVTAVDDYTECKVCASVKIPSGSYFLLEGNSFVASVAGTYTITYLVMDENCNVTSVSYDVTVA